MILGYKKSVIIAFVAGMVELVDTQDLKSCECKLVRVQVPLLVHSTVVPYSAILFPVLSHS